MEGTSTVSAGPEGLRTLQLHDEHVRLGARFGSFGAWEVPLDYGIAFSETLPLDHPLIADVSYQGAIHVTGADSARFLQTMLTADICSLEVLGAGAPALALTPAGEVIDLLYVIRTGDAEYLIVASAPNTDEVVEWLTDHSAVADDEGRLFPDVSVHDQTGQLAAIVLMGPGYIDMLAEFAAAPERVHGGWEAGMYLGSDIGGIPLMMVRVRECEDAAILYGAPAGLRALWEALLGFPELQAVGFDQLVLAARYHGLWLDGVEEGRYRTVAEAGLGHLVRPEGGFVGAAAL
ncbi:MAG: hypothetical protein ACOYIP_08485 [Coriobacteriales bacterium]